MQLSSSEVIWFLLISILVIINIIDWLQTEYIAKHPERFRESWFLTKRIIGEYPSVTQVTIYFIFYMIIQIVAALFMGVLFTAGLVVLRLWPVIHNYKIGIKLWD